MHAFSLHHVSNDILLQDLAARARQGSIDLAWLLAHLAEVEKRKLYVPEACSSMLDYCVRKLQMSEDEALQRLRAARAARKFPPVFEAVASGRLHLTAVVMLRTHLNRDNVSELLKAAAYRSKAELQLLLAERFPKADVPTEIRPLGSNCQEPPKISQTLVVPEPPAGGEPQSPVNARENVTMTEHEASGSERSGDPDLEVRAEVNVGHSTTAEAPAPSTNVGSAPSWARVTPRSTGRFALQVAIGQETHDKLRRAQELLGPRISSGDLAQVIDLALGALIRKLEKSKLGASDRPRAARQQRVNGTRHIPNASSWRGSAGDAALAGRTACTKTRPRTG